MATILVGDDLANLVAGTYDKLPSGIVLPRTLVHDREIVVPKTMLHDQPNLRSPIPPLAVVAYDTIVLPNEGTLRFIAYDDAHHRPRALFATCVYPVVALGFGKIEELEDPVVDQMLGFKSVRRYLSAHGLRERRFRDQSHYTFTVYAAQLPADGAPADAVHWPRAE